MEDEDGCCGYWGMVGEELAEEFDAQEVVPKLYIGSKSAATSVNQLKSHNITHILSVSTNPPTKLLNSSGEFKCLSIEIEDDCQKDLLSHFPECHQFIETGRKLGGILIHCTAGVSRSATVVISYLMSIFFKPFWDCFQYLRKIRPCIQPNKGFVSQLISYESTLINQQKLINNNNNNNNSCNCTSQYYTSSSNSQKSSSSTLQLDYNITSTSSTSTTNSTPQATTLTVTSDFDTEKEKNNHKHSCSGSNSNNNIVYNESSIVN
eukprot:gene5527-6885_t